MTDLVQILDRQMAADYHMTLEQIRSTENQFSVYVPSPDRRKYDTEGSACFLKAACYHGKIIMTGQEEIIRWCSQEFSRESSFWFMEFGTLRKIDEECRKYGYRICQAHPFFIPEGEIREPEPEGEITWYDPEAIEQFRGDDRFPDAFTFVERAPDRIGVSLTRNGKIVGMAGASADSNLSWQIGIDVLPEARGGHIGTILVSRLTNRIISKGLLPYYGTAVSHIQSQNVAIHSGFRPAWTEFYTVQV